ncbi:elastin-like [Diabrotica virgifera virgifera]|uniref:Elastin-like isoform X1 n=1 Tax=Diabrotica virgifera virgifera TaxID=50390 RepID=A0A6P7GR61_DIAVI|nr:elastin-like [Diabrotica virgifera virgifera]
MNSLSVAVLFVAVAAVSASGLLGHGLVASRGAVEGALGGQWIPDVPVAGHGAGIVGAGVLGHGSARGALEGALGGQWIPDVPVAHGAPAAVLAAPAAIAARGVLGAPLGLGLGLGAVGPLGLGGVGPLGLGAVGPLGLGLGLGHGIGHGVSARGALEGALGGQWIPDTHGHH